MPDRTGQYGHGLTRGHRIEVDRTLREIGIQFLSGTVVSGQNDRDDPVPARRHGPHFGADKSFRQHGKGAENITDGFHAVLQAWSGKCCGGASGTTCPQFQCQRRNS
jgi:hypothetical protein